MTYNSMLQLAHFRQAAFRDTVRDVFPHFATDAAFPENCEGAKVWEIAKTIEAFRKFNVLRPDSEVLGVAAGYEHTAYWLTNHVKRVYVTDLYEASTEWKEANEGMLFDASPFAFPGFEWNRRRLVVQHMNALDLRYEDNSFDGVFSSGSIEHFGSLANVATAMSEIGRVLKPGAIACVTTEFRISGPSGELGIPGAIMFTPAMLKEYIVKASGLTLVDEPEWMSDEETKACAYPLQEAVDNGPRSRSVALTHGGFTWTSGAICLRKEHA